MITILFWLLMLAVFGRLVGLAIRMAWGITKLVCSFLLLPLILIGLVFAGLIYLALPILIIVGIVSLVKA